MIDSIPALIAGSAILYKPSENHSSARGPRPRVFQPGSELADVVDYAMGAGATAKP